MRAAVLTKFGRTADVFTIQERPQPNVAPDQVLIRVHAASVNPVDVQTRNGVTRIMMPIEPPVILGVDAAGVISAVGAQVTRFKVGDEVFVNTGLKRMNTLADYCVAAESAVALKPKRLSFVEAAALPLVALTAWQALNCVPLGSTSRVFIEAGSGGVGSCAIQMAKSMGAYVATTASARHHQLMRELGADEVIDYKAEKFYQRLDRFDFMLEMMGGGTLRQGFAILRPGATAVSLSIPDPATVKKQGYTPKPWINVLLWTLGFLPRRRAKRAGVDFVPLATRPSGDDLAQVATMVDTGYLRPIIDRVYPLDEVGAAFMHVAAGHTVGKVVVENG